MRRVILRFVLATALSIPGVANAEEKVRLLLDWGWLPYHAAFFLAQERGYFHDAGVDVEVEQGRGSNTTAILVGQGSFDMGHLNVTNATAAIAKGVPLRVVAVYQHRTAASFVGIRGRVTLAGPDSLKGLKIGSTPGGSDGLSLTIFQRANHIPDGALNVISLDATAKTAALLTGQVDVVSGDSHAYQAIVRGAGQTPEVMELADFGVPLLGFGFAVNETFLHDKPDAIRKTLAAIRHGFADMAADPETACTLIRSRVQIAGKPPQCVDYITGLLRLSTPPADPSWGRSTPEEWDKLIATLKDTGEIKGDRAPATYYSNDYLP
jgi:NitT/TauT family transport system substrate-binding protein